MPITKTEWISSVLANDESSSDREIASLIRTEYPDSSLKEIKHYLSQRDRMLVEINAKIVPYNPRIS